MSCIKTALERLRAAHPQWGWIANERMTLGELETVSATVAVTPTHAGWLATITVWTGDDWQDHTGEGVDVVRAFEAARRAAGLEVVR